MSDATKTKWDKADVILKPVGGLLTALAVTVVGIFASLSLERRQTEDTNSRLYAELMSKREEADSSLRKDMFKSIIETFLKPKSSGYAQKVLNLELLSYNFHEALNLGPLFKDVYAEIADSRIPQKEKEQLIERLERAATDVTGKQVEALKEDGEKIDGVIDFQDLRDNPEGLLVLDRVIEVRADAGKDSAPVLYRSKFRVEALYADQDRKEIRLKLLVQPVPATGAESSNQEAESSIDSVFRLGFFDFPMIDNIRLPNAYRCAAVLREFSKGQEGPDAGSAEFTLVYFPGSRASLKEKPFYDEVLQTLHAPRSGRVNLPNE